VERAERLLHQSESSSSRIPSYFVTVTEMGIRLLLYRVSSVDNRGLDNSRSYRRRTR
jgi:hypothetical protein